MTVADYSSGPISPARLRAAGITGVVRYVTGGSASKHITAAEYRDLLAGQIAVALVYEASEQTLIASGWDARTTAEAIRNDCAALGYEGAVYIAADWDMTATQWPTARSRLRAVSGVLGLTRTGLYGSYDAITWSVRDGAATWFWQSMSRAFSAGRNAVTHPRAHLHQRSTSTVDGHSVDLNDVLSPQWGQTPVTAPAQNIEEDDVLTLVQRGYGTMAQRTPVYVSNGINHRWVQTPAELVQLQNWITQHWKNGDGKIIKVANDDDFRALAGVLVGPDPEAPQPASGPVDTPGN